MATTVIEKFLGRSGKGTLKAEREYTRMFEVITTSLITDSRTILSSTGLPLIGDLYVGADGVPDELGATLHEYTAEHAEDFLWRLTAHYTNQPRSNTGPGRDGQQKDTNPLSRPTEISVDGVTFEKPIDYTPDGAPICSSTGERFDPAVSRDDSRRTFVMTRVESGPSAIADAYKDVLNSDTWQGYPPGTAKMGLVKEVRADENGQLYWRVTYPISIDLIDGWDAKVIDVGTKWLDSTGQTHYAFFDATGATLSGAQPLNGEGRPLHMQGVPTGPLAPGAVSKLTAGIGATDDFITVASAAGFPQRSATYPIVLKIDSELIQGIALAGNTFGCVRGYGGSVPATHTINAVVQMQPYYLRFKRYRSLPFAALNLP